MGKHELACVPDGPPALQGPDSFMKYRSWSGFRGESSGRLARKLDGIAGDHDARHLAGRPDVNGPGEIGRGVERTALDADRIPAVLVAAEDACAAPLAEEIIDGAAAVGGARPALEQAFDDPHISARDDHRDAENRGRLRLALAAMAGHNYM